MVPGLLTAVSSGEMVLAALDLYAFRSELVMRLAISRSEGDRGALLEILRRGADAPPATLDWLDSSIAAAGWPFTRESFLALYTRPEPAAVVLWRRADAQLRMIQSVPTESRSRGNGGCSEGQRTVG